MVSTAGGRRPSRPNAWRSSNVNAVPLFSDGVSRRARPRRSGERRVATGGVYVMAIGTSRGSPQLFHSRLERKENAILTHAYCTFEIVPAARTTRCDPHHIPCPARMLVS